MNEAPVKEGEGSRRDICPRCGTERIWEDPTWICPSCMILSGLTPGRAGRKGAMDAAMSATWIRREALGVDHKDAKWAKAQWLTSNKEAGLGQSPEETEEVERLFKEVTGRDIWEVHRELNFEKKPRRDEER